MTVRVTGTHRHPSRRPNLPGVAITRGQNRKYRLPYGAAPSRAPACVQVSRPVRTGNSIPAIVRDGAELEVGLCSAERLVAAVPRVAGAGSPQNHFTKGMFMFGGQGRGSLT